MLKNNSRYGWIFIFITTVTSLTVISNHNLATPAVTFIGTNEVMVNFVLPAAGVYKLRRIPGAVQ